MSKDWNGPWTWHYWNDVGPDDAYFEEGYSLQDADGRPVDEDESKRRLAASAPQMYELLVAAAVTERYEPGGWVGCREAIRALLQQIDGDPT